MSESVKFVVSILAAGLISGLIIGIDLLYRRKVIKRQVRQASKKRQRRRKAMGNQVLSNRYSRITILDTVTGEEIAVITNNVITTAADNIVVKLTPFYD